MKILGWIKDFFGDQDIVYLNEKIAQESEKLAIEDFAIMTAINLIAGCISTCEFKTYANGKPVKSDEYYLWNIEPNKNQNSTEFILEIVSKLLYYNECLVVEHNGQLIIADNYYKEDLAIVESYFTNVSRGSFTFNKTFMISDVLYFKLNNKDVRRLLSRLMGGYTKLINMAVGKYKRSGGRKGIAKIDKTNSGDKKKQEKIDDLFQNRFKSYFDSENAVLHLPNGVDYEEKNGEGNKKSTSDMVDIQNLTRESFDRAAQAYKIPPALLKGDIADVEKITENLLTFGIDPVVKMIATEIVRKRYGKEAFKKGNYIFIDTTCIRHIDIFKIAEKIDKLISSGMYSVDGLLQKVGDVPIGEEWSGKHWITKNYADIETVEGGEKYDKNNI